MNTSPPDSDPAPDPEANLDPVREIVDAIAAATVAAIVADEDPATLAAAVTRGTPTDLDRRTALALSRQIRQRTPDPRNGYALPKSARNERNAPCPCGSGRKYKHCCETVDATLPELEAHYLPELLEELPHTDWRSLVGSRIDLELLADVVDLWLEAGRAGDVVLLLEPFFVEKKQFRRRQGALLHGLLDAYEEMRQPRLQRRLLDQAVLHGDDDVRFLAHLYRASIALDDEDRGAARASWTEASRIDADAPSLAELDLRLLLLEERGELVATRAGEWRARLDRADYELDPELDALLRDAADRGVAALL